MKRSTSLCLLVALHGWMDAQITVTNATFPVAGDTLRITIDRSDIPAQPLFTPPGGGQTWDLSFLSPDAQQCIVYRPAGEGAAFGSFPAAALVTIDANGLETYFDVTSTSFSIAGLSGTDPLGLIPIEMQIPMHPPLTERSAPLNFFDIRQSSSGTLVGFPAAEIPAELLAQLPVVPDSIRIRMSINLLSAVDAWGDMRIPGGIYQVLRDKRTMYTETRIDGKIPPLGWLDITDIAMQLLGLTGLGVDTTTAFYFFSNSEKEPIARIQFNNALNAIEEVQYKDNMLSSAVGDVSAAQTHVVVSPNPVSDMALVEIRNFNSGNYTLHLFDIRGTHVMASPLRSSSTWMSLGSMHSGTYFYQVLDERNQVVGRGKVVKVGG